MIYNDFEALSGDGQELDEELFRALSPIVNKYAINNSTREILSAIVFAAVLICAEVSLTKAVAKRKEKRAQQFKSDS
jgi:hypothetical protein